MIIDDKTFVEMVTHLQRGSLALADAADSINQLLDQDSSDEHLWTCTLDNLTTTNTEMGALSDILKAVFVANQGEKQSDQIIQ